MTTTKLAPGERFFTEKRTVTFRKEEFEYLHTGIIDENGEMWTTTELDEANVNQVYNQYRKKYGIPFPDEIKALRKHYGLSAAKMSEILGFGVNQYRYYEDGEVPSVSNARSIIAIRDKSTFLEFLSASRESLSEKEYQKILRHAERLPKSFKPQTIPSVMSGYAALSLDKIRAAVIYFVNAMNGVFITKMNKLLFYADFLAYKRTGFGITGMEYVALQYGPVPDQWGKVYSTLDNVSMNECIRTENSTGIMLETDRPTDLSLFSEEEKSVLEEVCELFKDTSAGNISNISHKEKGWIDNHKGKGYINYQYAFDLSIQ